ILKPRDRQCAIEPVESIIDVESARRARENAQAEDLRLHVTSLTPFAVEKRTSNSVQSLSERTRRNSPPCNRASSRARLRPIPWPDAAEGLQLWWNHSEIILRREIVRPVFPTDSTTSLPLPCARPRIRPPPRLYF